MVDDAVHQHLALAVGASADLVAACCAALRPSKRCGREASRSAAFAAARSVFDGTQPVHVVHRPPSPKTPAVPTELMDASVARRAQMALGARTKHALADFEHSGALFAFLRGYYPSLAMPPPNTYTATCDSKPSVYPRRLFWQPSILI